MAKPKICMIVYDLFFFLDIILNQILFVQAAKQTVYKHKSAPHQYVCTTGQLKFSQNITKALTLIDPK